MELIGIILIIAALIGAPFVGGPALIVGLVLVGIPAICRLIDYIYLKIQEDYEKAKKRR